MQSHITSYLSYLRAADDRSPHTIALYERGLNSFFSLFPDLTENSLAQYRDKIMSLPVSNKTKNLRLIPLRQFLRYLSDEKNMTIPVKKIKLFSEKKEREILDIPQPAIMEKIIASTDGRTKLILMLLCNTGLRLSEMLSLEVGQIKKEFPIIGKGGKQRLIFCSDSLVALVREYEQGMTGTLFPVSARCINALFSSLSKKNGVHIHPHLCRHFFAIEMLKKSGNNIVSVQQFLGHSSLETTRRYLKYSNGELAAIHRHCFG